MHRPHRVKPKSWYDITLKQFNKIQSFLETPDKYTLFNIIDVVYGVDSIHLPIGELPQYDINFLKESVPKVKLRNKYTLNGTVYQSGIDLTEVKAGQFLDYQNYVKDGAGYEKLLSVFFIPQGHEYNDGYDLKQAQEDLENLDIVTVTSLAFFFRAQLELFAILFQRSLHKTIVKMNIPEKEKVLKELEDWVSSGYSTGYGITHRTQTLH